MRGVHTASQMLKVAEIRQLAEDCQVGTRVALASHSSADFQQQE